MKNNKKIYPISSVCEFCKFNKLSKKEIEEIENEYKFILVCLGCKKESEIKRYI